MKVMKMTQFMILWILIINIVLILVGCTKGVELENLEIVDKSDIITTEEKENILYYSVEDAERIASSLLTVELKESGFDVAFDREVEISRIEYKNPIFYRFLIEDDFIALETAILINKETGSPLIAYPDDTYISVNEEELFISNRPIWYGSYGKKDTPDNYYTILTVSQSLNESNHLYIVMNSYFGAGNCIMKFDAEMVEPNLAVYYNETEKIEIRLNDDNTLNVSVETEDTELFEMLNGEFL